MSAQAKVEGLEAQVQDLQQQLKVLKVENVRETAELDTLTEYIRCVGTYRTAHAQQPAERPPHIEQLHDRTFNEQVR